MTPNYENDHSRLLNRLALDADALARKAGAWFDQLATAKAEAATAQDAFLADFHADSAARFAEAQTRVRDLTTVATAVENSGGPTEARARALLTPAAFSAFTKGFAERIDTLNKLIPVALKRLGARRAVLTEAGVVAAVIESDPAVGALRTYHQLLVDQLAEATAAHVFSSVRGAGHRARTFDALYADLTLPLPVAPATNGA